MNKIINYKPRKYVKRPLNQVETGKVIKVTSGGRHAWVESNVGIIRKPLEK